MAKAKSKKVSNIPIFWLVLSILMIFMGVDGVHDAYNYEKYGNPYDANALYVPLVSIILGGMILGVAINKTAQQKRSK